MSSRQTSGSTHSTEALQKTHGLYVVQLSPRHTAQRVQFPASDDDDSAATVAAAAAAAASEMRWGGFSVSLPLRALYSEVWSELPDAVKGMRMEKKTEQSPSLVATFNMADDGDFCGRSWRAWQRRSVRLIYE